MSRVVRNGLAIASHYVLFAVMGESTHALLIEAAVATLFLAVTLVGFKHSLWLVVAALAAHGVLDMFHSQLIVDRGVPVAGVLSRVRRGGSRVPDLALLRD